MAKKSTILLPQTQKILTVLGENIRLARLRRNITAKLEAERADLNAERAHYEEQATLFQKEKAAFEKERRQQKAMAEIKKRYGKNAILKGMNFEEAGTTKDRNEEIGGHRA